MDTKEWTTYAPILLRIGLSAVFLWFGLNQLFDTETFMGYLPEFLLASSYAKAVVLINGLFETAAGLLLLLGYFVRPVSFLLGLHLLGIMASLGYNDIAIRDFGLMLATFSITLGGNDKWCRQKKS